MYLVLLVIGTGPGKVLFTIYLPGTCVFRVSKTTVRRRGYSRSVAPNRLQMAGAKPGVLPLCVVGNARRPPLFCYGLTIRLSTLHAWQYPYC